MELLGAMGPRVMFSNNLDVARRAQATLAGAGLANGVSMFSTTTGTAPRSSAISRATARRNSRFFMAFPPYLTIMPRV